MFAGYEDFHAGEACEFFNQATKRIIKSQSALLYAKNKGYFKKEKDLISFTTADDTERESEEQNNQIILSLPI